MPRWLPFWNDFVSDRFYFYCKIFYKFNFFSFTCVTTWDLNKNGTIIAVSTHPRTVKNTEEDFLRKSRRSVREGATSLGRVHARQLPSLSPVPSRQQLTAVLPRHPFYSGWSLSRNYTWQVASPKDFGDRFIHPFLLLILFWVYFILFWLPLLPTETCNKYLNFWVLFQFISWNIFITKLFKKAYSGCNCVILLKAFSQYYGSPI